MSHEESSRVAQALLSRLGAGADEVAELFSPDLDWNIPGDSGAFPWIGRRTGRAAASDFISHLRELMEPLRFEVHEVLTSESTAVILGDLASRSVRTGKTVETAFAIVLTVSGNQISRFLMLEDSFAVSRAAKS